METISVTIPREKEALIKTAGYLRSLAGAEVAQVTGDPIEVELNPQKEADEMEARMDETIAAAASPSGLELDTDGRPWDARIDSGAKSKTKDGRWKLIRGSDPVLVEQVKAELTAVAPAVVAPVETPAVVAPVETPAVVAPVVQTPQLVAITTYAQLIPRITAQAKAGVLQKDDVLDALNYTGAYAAGAVSIVELAKPEYATLIPLVATELERLWATRA